MKKVFLLIIAGIFIQLVSAFAQKDVVVINKYASEFSAAYEAYPQIPS